MCVIELHRKNRVFTLQEANDLIKVIYSITAKKKAEVDKLFNQMENKYSEELEKQVNDLIQQWQRTLESLGVHTKGLYIADIDSGEGYYCWKFPETEIKYHHKYCDGFSKRKVL